MPRIAMSLAYQGTAYHGWQAQIDALPSVQRAVERALSRLADHPVSVNCAGRTDAGVHASKQVIHFDTHATRDLVQWVRGANFFLPKDIRILHAALVDDEFHARFSAKGRQYHYVIYQGDVASPFLRDIATWQPQLLDIKLMQQAAVVLIGEHDFSAFRGRDCQAKSPIKTLYDISLQKKGHLIIVTLHANAFLHHMVRNIVGCLFEVGLSKRAPEWLSDVLRSKDRRCAAAMAPPNGLYLADVFYADAYVFPTPQFYFT